MTNYQDQYGNATDQYGYRYDGFGNKYDQQGGRYNAWSGVRNDFVMFPQKPTSIWNTPSPPPPQAPQRRSAYTPPSNSTHNPPSYKADSLLGKVFKMAVCGTILLGGAFFAYQHLNPDARIGKGVLPALSFRPVCGSPPNSGSIWYGVMGSSHTLNLVKATHCGDAFINSSGTLQVASFTSRSEAKKFADNLSNQTGYQFWVSNK